MMRRRQCDKKRNTAFGDTVSERYGFEEALVVDADVVVVDVVVVVVDDDDDDDGLFLSVGNNPLLFLDISVYGKREHIEQLTTSFPFQQDSCVSNSSHCLRFCCAWCCTHCLFDWKYT